MLLCPYRGSDKMTKISREEIEKESRLMDSRNYYVVEKNSLIQKSKYNLKESQGKSLSLVEKKILLYIISRIKPTDTELKEQIFTIKEFCDVCGIDVAGGNNYKYLKDSIGKLADRHMWLEDNEKVVMVRWINKAIIHKNSGTIRIRLDEDLAPYLLSLKDNYTQYSLHNIIKMKSKYGIMLYELLHSYLYKGEEIRFNIETLKELLDCVNYTDFYNFKKRVIETALKDINTYSELKVSVRYVKEQKAVKYLYFNIVNLEKATSLEDKAEGAKRYSNVEKEIDPDQITLYDILYSSKRGLEE